MKFFLGIDDFRSYKLIKENIDEAKKLLASKNIPLDNPDFLIIKNEILKNNPGYLGLFTKFHFADNEKESASIDDLKKLMNWIQINKLSLKDLKKPLLQFNTYEELTDDIQIIETIQSVKSFVQQFPNFVRTNWNQQPRDLRYQQAIFLKGVIKAGKEREFLQKSKRFEKLPFDVFVQGIQDFYERTTNKKSFEDILNEINNTPDAILTYSNADTGVLIASIKTHTASATLGSPSWCISYKNNTSYFNTTYMAPDLFNTQYFVWNTDLPVSDNLSMVGVTISPDGKVLNIHNKVDTSIRNNIENFFNVNGLTIDNFPPLNAKLLNKVDEFISTDVISESMDEFLKNYDVIKNDVDSSDINLVISNSKIKNKLFKLFSNTFAEFSDGEYWPGSFETFKKYYSLFSSKYPEFTNLAVTTAAPTILDQMLSTFLKIDDAAGKPTIENIITLAKGITDLKALLNDKDISTLIELPKVKKEIGAFFNYTLLDMSIEEFDSSINYLESNSDINSYNELVNIYRESKAWSTKQTEIKTAYPDDFLKYLKVISDIKSKTIQEQVIKTSGSFSQQVRLSIVKGNFSLPENKEEFISLLNEFPILNDLFKYNETVITRDEVCEGKKLLCILISKLPYADFDLILNPESSVGGIINLTIVNKYILYDRINSYDELQEWVMNMNWDLSDGSMEQGVKALFKSNSPQTYETFGSKMVYILPYFIDENIRSGDLTLQALLDKYNVLYVLFNESNRSAVLDVLTIDEIIELTQIDNINPLKESDFNTVFAKVTSSEEFFKLLNIVTDKEAFLTNAAKNITDKSVGVAFDIYTKIKNIPDGEELLEVFEYDFSVNQIFVESVKANNTEEFFNHISENEELLNKIDLEDILDTIDLENKNSVKSVADLVEHFDIEILDNVSTMVYGLSLLNNGRYGNNFYTSAKSAEAYEKDGIIYFEYNDFFDDELGIFYEDGKPVSENYYENFEGYADNWDEQADKLSDDNIYLINLILKADGYNLDNYNYEHILNEESDYEEDEEGETIESNPEGSSIHEDIKDAIVRATGDADASAKADEYYKESTEPLTNTFFTAGYEWIGADNNLLLKMKAEDFVEFFKGCDIEQLKSNIGYDFHFTDVMKEYMDVNSDEAIRKPEDPWASIDKDYYNDMVLERLAEVASSNEWNQFQEYKKNKTGKK